MATVWVSGQSKTKTNQSYLDPEKSDPELRHRFTYIIQKQLRKQTRDRFLCLSAHKGLADDSHKKQNLPFRQEFSKFVKFCLQQKTCLPPVLHESNVNTKSAGFFGVRQTPTIRGIAPPECCGYLRYSLNFPGFVRQGEAQVFVPYRPSAIQVTPYKGFFFEDLNPPGGSYRSCRSGR